MTHDAQYIERLVRAAIERIVAEVRTPTATNAAATQPNMPSKVATNEFTIPYGVVGTRELQELPVGTRRVVVVRGAVVTPAAKELLRDKKIDLVWKTESANSSAANSKLVTKSVGTILLGEALVKDHGAAIAALLTKKGYAVERIARSGLESVAGELAVGAARDGRQAVLLTDRPFAAIVAANRHAGTRAAWLRDRGDAQRAVREIDANLAVIDPTGRSMYELTNILTPFLER